MQFQWNDLITRARVYVDDDNSDESSWIAPQRWLTLFQVEYAQLYRQWVRTGLVIPAATNTAFVGQTKTIYSVLAIIGVAEDLGYTKRLLSPAQSRYGKSPFWDGTANVGKSTRWEASGAADTLLITLHPQDASSNYVVRYLTYPAYTCDPTDVVDLPYGTDERLVLGAVKRANVKGSTRSAAVEDLIMKADAELAFTAAGRIDGDGPRVRRNRPHPFRGFGLSTDRFGTSSWPASPSDWFWA